jgi:hypothetical protein
VNKKFLSLAFTILLSLCLAPSLVAQESRALYKDSPANRERLSQVMAPTGNVEAFRREYDNYLAEMQQVMGVVLESRLAQRAVKQKGLAPIEQLAAARHSLSEMSVQDLTVLRSALARNPSWRQTPQIINSLFRAEVRSGLKAVAVKEMSALGDVPNPAGISLGGGVTPDNCSDAFLNGEPRVSNTDISIAQALVIAAHAVMEALPTDALTFEAHAAAGATVAGLEGAVLTLETLKAISDDCSGQALEDYITSNLDTTVSSRASQATADSIENRLIDRLDVKVSTRATQARTSTSRTSASSNCSPTWRSSRRSTCACRSKRTWPPAPTTPPWASLNCPRRRAANWNWSGQSSLTR